MKFPQPPKPTKAKIVIEHDDGSKYIANLNLQSWQVNTEYISYLKETSFTIEIAGIGELNYYPATTLLNKALEEIEDMLQKDA